MRILPLASAAATGIIDEFAATGTHAQLAVKGSYVPILMIETAAVGASMFIAPQTTGDSRAAITGAGVGAAALLGRHLTWVITGRTKL